MAKAVNLSLGNMSSPKTLGGDGQTSRMGL